MAAYDDAIKSCVNPVWRLLASEGGNRPKFDMAKQEDHHPRYTTTPASSAAPCDVDSRSQRFAAAARQVGSTTPQSSVQGTDRGRRKRKWEPGGSEFERMAATMAKMVALGQKALGTADKRRTTKRGTRAGSHVQGRQQRPKDPTTGRFVARGEGVESRNLDTRKTEDTGGLVAAVAGLVDSRTHVPHRKGRPKLKDERRRRKEAEAKNVVLQQKVKIMQESLAGQVHDEEARMDIVGNPEVAVMFLDMKLKTQAVGMQRRAEERKQLEAEVESLKVALKTERERTQALETKEADGSRLAVGEREREKERTVMEAAKKRLEQQAVEHRESFRCLTEENARVRSERRAAEAALQEEVRVVTRERDHLRSCSRVQAISEGAAQVDPAVKAPKVRKAHVQKQAKERPAPFGEERVVKV